MKKQRFLLSAALIFSLVLAACGSGAAPGADAVLPGGGVPSAVPSPMPSAEAGWNRTASETMPQTPAAAGSTAAQKKTKLILRASISIQSTEFDAAVTALDKLVEAHGGYYERSEIQQGEFYDSRAARYGSFTVRVPQEHFDVFLNAAGDVGHVVSSTKSSEDVGEAYFDAEARLKTQRTKLDRLLALLEEADNMENIISLESAIADTEYQIEQFTGTLRRYDSLVGYSTINVNLSEVLKIEELPKETTSLGGRVANAFSGGMDHLGENLGNFVVWTAYHFVGVVLFFILAAAGVVTFLRVRRKNRKSKDE